MIVAALLMLANRKEIKQAADIAAISSGTTITNPDIKEYEGETLRWRIRAKQAQEKNSVVMLQSPVIDLFSDHGKLIPIQAEQGRYHKKEQQIHLSGNVVVNFDRWTLSSELLDYDQVKEEIKAVEPFILKTQDIKVTGKDMTIFKRTERVQVLKGVHMVMENKR